jgi:hypothetical protein
MNLIPSRAMQWPWRKRGEPASELETGTGSRYSATLDAFLEHARAMAAWHEARADAFERKASTLLGFVGVILVLLPSLRSPIAKADGQWVRTLLVVLAIVAAVLLASAALASAMVLRPREYDVPSLEQLRREWTAYYDHPARTPQGITGMFVDQLVQGTGQRSPIETLRDDAEKRASWMKWATWLVLFGVLALAALTSALLVKGGV